MSSTQKILIRAKETVRLMRGVDDTKINAALNAMAAALIKNTDRILEKNAIDIENAKDKISPVMIDRLRLTKERIAAMADGVAEITRLPSPIGNILSTVERPNGLVIDKVSVPMGVIAIIYESRPNVTSDAAALAIKSGNVAILRGGKEAYNSARAIVDALEEGLDSVGLPKSAVQLVSDTTRESATEIMRAKGYVDLLIPRGGAGLIRACVENATVPCLETGTGICHIYVDKSANLEMALNIIENAKTFDKENPLSKEETDIILGIAAKMTESTSLPCTACRYCTDGCPMGLDIPVLIEKYNEFSYAGKRFIPGAISALQADKRPSACIGCRACEAVCPQGIKISEAMSAFSEDIESLEKQKQ